jgi:transcriptional regulator with XRE-family HTH domain
VDSFCWGIDNVDAWEYFGLSGAFYCEGAMSIGMKLKAYRRAGGLSQSALAEQLNIDDRMLRRWEAEDFEPAEKHMHKIRPLIAPFDMAQETILQLVTGSSENMVAIDLTGRLMAISGSAYADIAPYYEATIGEQCIPIPEQLVDPHRNAALDRSVFKFVSRYTERYGDSNMLTTSHSRIIRELSRPLVVWSYTTIEVHEGLAVPHELSFLEGRR